jgi:hypothetical protein
MHQKISCLKTSRGTPGSRSRACGPWHAGGSTPLHRSLSSSGSGSHVPCSAAAGLVEMSSSASLSLPVSDLFVAHTRVPIPKTRHADRPLFYQKAPPIHRFPMLSRLTHTERQIVILEIHVSVFPFPSLHPSQLPTPAPQVQAHFFELRRRLIVRFTVITDQFFASRSRATSLHRNLAASLVQLLHRKNICASPLFSSAFSCATISPVQ